MGWWGLFSLNCFLPIVFSILVQNILNILQFSDLKLFQSIYFFEEQPWFTVKKKKGKSIEMFLLPRWQLPPITSILHQGCIGCYWWARAQSVVYIRVRSWCWLLIFSLLIFCFQFHWFFLYKFLFLVFWLICLTYSFIRWKHITDFRSFLF